MSRGALYTVGNLTIDDIVVWPSGQTWMGQLGGNGLFSALGARIWVDGVGLLARLGKDYPRDRLNDIAGRGISLALQEVDAPSLHDWALYEAGGRRQFVNHLTSGSNDVMTLHADEIPLEHLEGRAYHIAPVPVHQQAALLRKLKRPGRLISLDPHEHWITNNEALIRAMLHDVDVFSPSELEAKRLSGAKRLEDAAREFALFGPKAVAIKLGAEGSFVYDRGHDRVTYVPAYPAHVRDTTGAGDAYCGGFLAGYLLTGDPVTAAQYGTVSASYTVETIGALAASQPTLADARARLELVSDRTTSASST